MGKTEKLLEKLANGTISADEARTLLRRLGWENARTKGSHEHWLKGGKLITMATHTKELRSYQIKQIQASIEE